MQLQRRIPKTRPRLHDAIDLPPILQLHPNTRPHRRTVRRPCPLKLQGQPMSCMPRIRQQRADVRIARKRPTQHLENILLPIAIEIRKRHCMPLLQLPKAARLRHILEPLAPVIAEHPVR